MDGFFLMMLSNGAQQSSQFWLAPRMDGLIPALGGGEQGRPPEAVEKVSPAGEDFFRPCLACSAGLALSWLTICGLAWTFPFFLPWSSLAFSALHRPAAGLEANISRAQMLSDSSIPLLATAIGIADA